MRSETDDRRHEKLCELGRMRRYLGQGRAHAVQGFAVVEWECCVCGTVNRGSRNPAAQVTLHCSMCGKPTPQDRYRRE